MHALHFPFCPDFTACAHSALVNSSISFGSRHSLHTRFSLQSMQTRSLQRLSSSSRNASADFQKWHIMHSYGVPASFFFLTHCVQPRNCACLPHCSGANSCLNRKKPQRQHMAEGVCFSSMAFQSTYSPRKVFNSSSGPSGPPFVKSCRSKAR